MRLTATIESFHAYIDGYLVCPILPRPQLIRFMLDTGCTSTTILQDDAIRLGLDCSRLQRMGSVRTASGNVETRCLTEVTLYLPARRWPLNIREGFLGKHYPMMCVMPPDEAYRAEHPTPDLSGSHSLLGMDLLLQFHKWEIRRNKLFLSSNTL